MDTKDKFKEEFENACNAIIKCYPYKEGLEREIVGAIINAYLHQIKCDIENMTFLDFFKKYLKGTIYLDCTDFTKSEIETIIKESRLNERDSKLAKLYWVDMKGEDDIASSLLIDRKTVRNNIPKISMVLKQTAAKIYSK